MVMSTKGNFEPDILSGAIPGQSLTANPGQFPYEKPPMTVDPEQALSSIVESFKQESTSNTIFHLLDAGLSAETIASGLTLAGVAEGVFDADVAELIKGPLIFYIVEIGVDRDVEDINVLDTMPEEGMDDLDGLELARTTSKSRHDKKLQKLRDTLPSNNNIDMEEQRTQEVQDIPQGFINRFEGEE